MKKILAIGLIALLLSGCETFKKKCDPVIITNEFAFIDPEPVQEPVLRNVEFQAWNKNKLYEESQKSSNSNEVYYVLTREELDKHMQNMINISDTMVKLFRSNKYYSDSIKAYKDGTDKKTP